MCCHQGGTMLRTPDMTPTLSHYTDTRRDPTPTLLHYTDTRRDTPNLLHYTDIRHDTPPCHNILTYANQSSSIPPASTCQAMRQSVTVNVFAESDVWAHQAPGLLLKAQSTSAGTRSRCTYSLLQCFLWSFILFVNIPTRKNRGAINRNTRLAVSMISMSTRVHKRGVI